MNKLRGSFSEAKTHFKMYKKGRQWLVAGVTVASIGLGVFGLNVTTASADTAAVQVTATQPSATEEPAGQSQSEAASTDTTDTTTDTTSTSDVTSTASAETITPATTATTETATPATKTTETTTTEATTPATAAQTPETTTATSTPVTTDLGDATAEDVAAAKTSAASDYQATGTPQKIVAKAAAAEVETPFTTEVKDVDGNTISDQQSAKNSYDVQTDEDGKITAVGSITTPAIENTIPDGKTLVGITIVDTAILDGQTQVTTTTWDPRTNSGNVVLDDNTGTWDYVAEYGSDYATEVAKAMIDQIISNSGNVYTVSFDRIATEANLLANGNVNQTSSTAITYTVTATKTINPTYTTEVRKDAGKGGLVYPAQTGTNALTVEVDADGNIVSVDSADYGQVTDTIPVGYDFNGVTMVEDTTSLNNTVTTITYDPTTGVGNYVLVTTDADGNQVTTDYAAEYAKNPDAFVKSTGMTPSDMAKTMYNLVITNDGQTYTTSFAQLLNQDGLVKSGNINQLADKTTIIYNVTGQPTSGSVEYVDQNNNQVVKEAPLDGDKVGDDGNYVTEVPAGYELVPGQASEIAYTLAPDNGTKLTVKIRPISTSGNNGNGSTGTTTPTTNPTTPETTPETQPTTDPTTPAQPEETVVTPADKPTSKPTTNTEVTPEPATKVTKQAATAVKTGTRTQLGTTGQATAGQSIDGQSAPTETVAGTEQAATAETLPQTDETTAPTTLIGLALLGLMSLFGIGAKKRREE